MNKIAFTLYFWQITALDKVKARRDAGQGTLEYVGMIAVAAVVIVLVIGAVKDGAIEELVKTAITNIKGAI